MSDRGAGYDKEVARVRVLVPGSMPKKPCFYLHLKDSYLMILLMINILVLLYDQIPFLNDVLKVYRSIQLN